MVTIEEITSWIDRLGCLVEMSFSEAKLSRNIRDR